MTDIVLEARDIGKSFPGVRALNGVKLQVRRGEVRALVGENGAGKSTLMLILAGVLSPDSGQILLNGTPASFSAPHDASRQGISIVFQELSLVPSLSVAENIFTNRQPIDGLGFINRSELNRRAREMLDLFDMDMVDPAMPVRNLPVSTQQVIEILKALSTDPIVLILDEPTSSLSDAETALLFRNISRLSARGVACIYISHHLPEIFEIADTVTVLRDGRFVCEAVVKDINENFLISSMVGRTIHDIYGARNPRASFGSTRFEARGLGREGVFQDISFMVHSGEIVGFAGLVGAGRTELARAIFGADRLDSGGMWLDGEKIDVGSPRDAIDLGIGYLTEDRKTQGLYLDFPIRMNLVSNRLGRFTRGLFMNEALVEARSADAIREFRISATGTSQVVNNLSGGNQQKVLLVVWIGIEPRLLIVDEPTRGVDVGARSEIYGFIRALAAQGTAIMMISSDLPEILGLSDRIVVIKNGRVASTLDAAQATEESVIALATGG